MAYQIIVKKRFTNKVQKVLTYLEKEWDHRTATEFLLKIDRRFDLLSKQPYAGAPSLKVKGVRGLLIPVTIGCTIRSGEVSYYSEYV